MASDEKLHEQEGRHHYYPPFGDSQTPYAPPPGMTRKERDAQVWVRDFYTSWAEFATAKRFEWISKWDLERGDDRSMRRLMEKENKKIRDDYKREYVDTIKVCRFLISRLIPSN